MQNLHFVLSTQEADVILQALLELPAKYSMLLIGKLQSQAAPQLGDKPAETPIQRNADTEHLWPKGGPKSPDLYPMTEDGKD